LWSGGGGSWLHFNGPNVVRFCDSHFGTTLKFDEALVRLFDLVGVTGIKKPVGFVSGGPADPPHHVKGDSLLHGHAFTSRTSWPAGG
jgi:hypothetical protein